MPSAKNEVRMLDRMSDIGDGRNYLLNLDKNERISPFHQKHIENIFASISSVELSRYPDQSPLYTKLSEFLKIQTGNILLTVGGDSGLKHIFETFVEKGDEVVTVFPTYAMISVYSSMFGADLKCIEYGEQLELTEADLLSSFSYDTKLVVIPNPNQPTGTLLAEEMISAMLKLARKFDFVLVLDEAYIEFADEQSFATQATKNKNLLVLRTFSKAWGLAGVRLGYITGETSMIGELKKVKTLLDINILSIKSACYFLERYDIVDHYIKEVKHSREFVRKELESAGIDVITGATNFVHLKVPKGTSPVKVADKLLAQGIKVRVAGGTASVLDGCIRITLGVESDMRKFLDEFFFLISAEDLLLESNDESSYE